MILFKKVASSPLLLQDGSRAAYNIYTKQYLSADGTNPPTIFPEDLVGQTRAARAELKKLLGRDVFDYAKPTDLIHYILKLTGCPKDSIILDFFSGSATTAHALMQLNAEDGGHRKFIMVQLPEPCDEKSEAFKAGYKISARSARSASAGPVTRSRRSTRTPIWTSASACSVWMRAI